MRPGDVHGTALGRNYAAHAFVYKIDVLVNTDTPRLMWGNAIIVVVVAVVTLYERFSAVRGSVLFLSRRKDKDEEIKKRLGSLSRSQLLYVVQ